MSPEETPTVDATSADATPSNDLVPPDERSLAKLWRKLRWNAYFLLPKLTPYPDAKDLIEWTERTAETNADTRVPDGEELAVPFIWAVEMYGPAEIESLYSALKRLGWATNDNNHGRGATRWIEEQRSYGEAGGWFNIGMFAGPRTVTAIWV